MSYNNLKTIRYSNKNTSTYFIFVKTIQKLKLANLLLLTIAVMDNYCGSHHIIVKCGSRLI